MSLANVHVPTPKLIDGELGDAIVVLSLPEIRSAELLEARVELLTADGVVHGRRGDVAVTAYGGERYPIEADVFFGTYEKLGRVGSRIVARRIVHARRAWPIVSASATFNYGDDRGTVVVQRGGWLYQSDDDDFGVINAGVKHEGHIEVGPARSIAGTDWSARFRLSRVALAFLPALLTLLALLAFVSARASDPYLTADVLIGTETFLLVTGAIFVWWMRSHRWELKAAVGSSFDTASDFQCAAALLGCRTSSDFPGMSLWRAAQLVGPPDIEAVIAKLGSKADAMMLELKSRLGKTRDALGSELKCYRSAERFSAWSALGAVVVIVAGNLCLLIGKCATLPEYLAICLPSLIGALHAFNLRRHLDTRLSAIRAFSAQLKFASDQLFAIVPGATSALSGARTGEDLEATLKFLCRVVAQHTHAQVQFAVLEVPELPV
jgi:hypothetical protein